MCGAYVAPGATQCQDCGHALPVSDVGAERRHAGLPAGRYVPSVYGPPIRPDVVPHAAEMESEAPARRRVGYRPVDLPPPPPTRGGSLRRVAARLLLLALVLAIVVAAVAFAKGAIPHTIHIGPSTTGRAPAAGAHVTATIAENVCLPEQVDPNAAKALTHVQLTSGLHDVGAHDYRPVNAVSTFHAGQTGYVTFQVATSEAGTVGVRFCSAVERDSGSFGVPAASAGRYGEFSAQFGDHDVGQGYVTLIWNGAVAAEVPFTVSP